MRRPTIYRLARRTPIHECERRPPSRPLWMDVLRTVAFGAALALAGAAMTIWLAEVLAEWWG